MAIDGLPLSEPLLRLRVLDAAGRYYDAHRKFERTKGDDEADKEFRAANRELLRAYRNYRAFVRKRK